MIRQLWPLLTVSDLQRSLAFYRDSLGFSVAGQAEDEGRVFWCRLEREGACVMLQEGPLPTVDGQQADRIGLYFVCDDVDDMFAELSGRGLDLEAPSTAYYGMRQLFVEEPDGHALCFESPTERWRG